MTCIVIDLEDYRDEVRYTFCDNNRCLKDSCGLSFKQRFKSYIDELDREIYIYRGGCKRTPEIILDELKNLYAELI